MDVCTHRAQRAFQIAQLLKADGKPPVGIALIRPDVTRGLEEIACRLIAFQTYQCKPHIDIGLRHARGTAEWARKRSDWMLVFTRMQHDHGLLEPRLKLGGRGLSLLCGLR